MDYYICLDIGGTNIRAALFNKNGFQPIKQIRIKTQSEGLKAEDQIITLIKDIWPANGTVKAIAAAAPGFVDSEKGIVIKAVNIPGWENLPLQQYIQEKFKVPVMIGNDARLAVLGEWKYGAARGHHNIIYLTISTGIGGGVIINDQVLMGSRGMATELGHITVLPDGPLCSCGQAGHLEAISSGPAIARYVQQQAKNGVQSSIKITAQTTSKEIAEAALEGDGLCLSAFKRAGTYLGIAIANFIHIFNPTCIVLGGGVSLTGDLLLKPIKKVMDEVILSHEYLKDLTFTTAELGDNAGLIGALVLIKINEHK
jgi:glucokinase